MSIEAAASPRPVALRSWVVLACLAGLCFSAGVVAGSLPPFVPAMMGDLRMTALTAGVALGAWQAATAIASVPIGLLLDRTRLRGAIAVGAALSVLSCLARALAGDPLTLIAAVALAGVGWPLVVGGSAKVLGTFYEGRRRRFAVGATLAAVSCGFATILATANPVLAAHLGGWRPALMATAIPMALAAVAWLAFAGPLAHSGSSDTSLGQVGRDLRELVGNAAVLTALGVTVGGLVTGHGLSNWLPTLLRAEGLSPNLADLSAAAFVGVGIFGALFLPLIARPSVRRWLMAGVLVTLAVAELALQSRSDLLIGVGLLAAGLCVGATPPLMILTLLDTPGVGRRSGAVTGLYYSITGISGLLGPVVVGSLVQLTGGFAAGLAALALIAAGGAALSLRLKVPAPVPLGESSSRLPIRT